jgi:transposase
MPRGRRTKLTVEVQKKIVDALSAGNYFEVACAYAGIAQQTGQEWLARGRDEHCHRPTNQLYAAFADAVEKAQADEEAGTIARIKKAAMGGEVIYERTVLKPSGETVTERRYSGPDWTADAWRQERKHYTRWGRKERREITGKDGDPLTPLITVYMPTKDQQNGQPSSNGHSSPEQTRAVP